MAEQIKTEQAKNVFATLCRSLEKNNWSFSKDEDNLTVECGAQGDDLPMEISIQVDVERQVAVLLSHMPFLIKENKRFDVAVAVSAINNALVDGSFDYNVTDGRMYFRMTNSFIESDIGEEVFAYMLACSCRTIDEYNDKFLMLSKGMVSLEQFIAAV